ncbi:hypothetical protein HK098_001695 [Nowakowskiella sp. JEL0407]|nr:hypothetical protein HK098_001695 [Nowakowskiella sp. JEL0407]
MAVVLQKTGLMFPVGFCMIIGALSSITALVITIVVFSQSWKLQLAQVWGMDVLFGPSFYFVVIGFSFSMLASYFLLRATVTAGSFETKMEAIRKMKEENTPIDAEETPTKRETAIWHDDFQKYSKDIYPSDKRPSPDYPPIHTPASRDYPTNAMPTPDRPPYPTSSSREYPNKHPTPDRPTYPTYSSREYPLNKFPTNGSQQRQFPTSSSQRSRSRERPLDQPDFGNFEMQTIPLMTDQKPHKNNKF